MFSKRLDFRGKKYWIAYKTEFPPNSQFAGQANHPSWFSFMDESTVRDSKWTIEPGDYVLDVGSAFGSYALTALACGAAHVVAWSPQGIPGDEDKEADYFAQSLRLNRWENKCQIIRSGVYDRDGWLNTLTQEFWEKEPPENNDIIRVSKLDTWFFDLDAGAADQAKRYFMKLDVEGAELHVLRGAERMIKLIRPHLLIENHLFKVKTMDKDVRALLEGWGFTHIETTPHHSVSHSLYEPK